MCNKVTSQEKYMIGKIIYFGLIFHYKCSSEGTGMHSGFLSLLISLQGPCWVMEFCLLSVGLSGLDEHFGFEQSLVQASWWQKWGVELDIKVKKNRCHSYFQLDQEK